MQNQTPWTTTLSRLAVFFMFVGCGAQEMNQDQMGEPVVTEYAPSPLCLSGLYEHAWRESKTEWSLTCGRCAEYRSTGDRRGQYFERCCVAPDSGDGPSRCGDWVFIKYQCGVCYSGPLE